jgi:hypothetical protein
MLPMLSDFLNHAAIRAGEREYLEEFAERSTYTRQELLTLLDEFEERQEALAKEGEDADAPDLDLVRELANRARRMINEQQPGEPGWLVAVSAAQYLIEEDDHAGDLEDEGGLTDDERVIDAAEEVLNDTLSLGSQLDDTEGKADL